MDPKAILLSAKNTNKTESYAFRFSNEDGLMLSTSVTWQGGVHA